jgi:hypothetical protein
MNGIDLLLTDKTSSIYWNIELKALQEIFSSHVEACELILLHMTTETGPLKKGPICNASPDSYIVIFLPNESDLSESLTILDM